MKSLGPLRAAIVGLTLSGLAAASLAQSPEGGRDPRASRDRLQEPLYRTAEAPVNDVPAQPAGMEHPLEPVLRMARDGLTRVDRDIVDYTCTLVKRERIGGKLGDYEYMYTKVRHKPFSVYMYFLGPDAVKGREVIFVAGQNNGKLIAHESGVRGLIGRVHLDPGSALAMKGQLYPITEVGIRTLTQRLIEVGEHDKQFGECEVQYFQGAKVQDRVCTCLQVVHPVPRREFRFHLARVYIDDELQLPIRYEAYEWPQQRDGRPVLQEEYTYTKLKVNVGLTDADFDPDNPNYKF
jgi:hypothetical protein